jgi:hypothetical protein
LTSGCGVVWCGEQESDSPRLMVYFRCTAKREKEDIASCPTALCDIWTELPAMRPIVDAELAHRRAARL